MLVRNARGSDLIWEALDENGEVWFESQISLYDFNAIKTTDLGVSHRLRNILRAAVRLNSEFLSTWSGFKVETQLEFPLNWGAGSSSTLITMIAEWAYINPFHLHFAVSNGSGYDIACAKAPGPILYQLKEDEVTYTTFEFKGNFTKNLYFVHLGKKQNSAKQIKLHSDRFAKAPGVVKRISEISKIISTNRSFVKFLDLIKEHEKLISSVTGVTPIQEAKFKNFNGGIKSLGAWGGDFILAASNEGDHYVKSYFRKNGYDTVLKFKDLALE